MYLHTIVPEHVTSRELAHVVRILGIRLIAKPDGSVIGIPITPERRGAERRNRIRHHKPIRNPPGPEAA